MPHIQEFAYIRTYAAYICFKTVKYFWRLTITGIHN